MPVQEKTPCRDIGTGALLSNWWFIRLLLTAPACSRFEYERRKGRRVEKQTCPHQLQKKADNIQKFVRPCIAGGDEKKSYPSRCQSDAGDKVVRPQLVRSEIRGPSPRPGAPVPTATYNLPSLRTAPTCQIRSAPSCGRAPFPSIRSRLRV